MCFWICYKNAPKINLVFESNFATNALYLYAFIASLFIFRVLFHYLRWVCPLVEYRSNNSLIGIHRIVLGTLALGWFGQFVYDVGKLIF